MSDLFNNIRVARKSFDGILPTKVRLFPRTIKQYPFFQGKTGLEQFRKNNNVIKMELAVESTNSFNIEENRFSDMHRLTEFSPVASYLIISPEFKDMLSFFKINDHKFYPITLHHLNEVRSYFLFHVIRPYGSLDFNKSIFGVFNDHGPQQGFVELMQEGVIRDKKDIHSFQEEYLIKYNKSPDFFTSKISKKKYQVTRSVRCRKAVFKDTYDIIAPIEGIGILVNDKVKNAIKMSGLKGWEIKDYQSKYFKIEMPDTTTI